MTEPTLSLRCTPRLAPAGPPALDAFAAGARLVDPADDVLGWLAPREPVPGTSGLRRRERLAPVPTFTPTTSAGDFALRMGRSLQDALPAPPPEMLALAAAVPLALSPALAFAQDPGDESAEQAPAGEDAGEDAGADAGADAGGPRALDLTPPDPAEDLSYTGSVLWGALEGRTVEVRMGDGLTVEGVVLTQTTTEVAIARLPDGDLMRVPKDLVLGLRVRPDTPSAPQVIVREAASPRDWKRERPPPGGKAMATVGFVLTGIGSTMMTTFAIGTAFDSSFPYYGFPLMILGPAFLGPGIPIMGAGLAREEERASWEKHQKKKSPDMDLSMGPTMDGGWAGRLTIKF